MAEGNPKVVTISSESEDELEIVSEKISNYGNYSTPVEVPTELQEKIRISLEKQGSLPGKIKGIKIYAIRGSSQEVGSVRASFQPSNGQASQTINVGPSINTLFSNTVFPNQVQGILNNNSRKKKTDQVLENYNQVQDLSEPPRKRSHQQVQDGAHQKVSGRPSTSSSPVTILYSPIRKRKSPKPRDILVRAFPSHGFQKTCPLKNLDEATPPIIPLRKYTGEFTFQENLEREVIKREEYENIKNREEKQVNISFLKSTSDPEMNTSDMTSNTMFKNSSGSFNSKVNAVMLSPMEFSSDETDDEQMDDTILAFCNSPIPSPKAKGSGHPFLKLGENDIEPTEDLVNMKQKNNRLNSEDIMTMSEIHEKFKECEIIAKQHERESKVRSMENEHENLVNQVEQDQIGEREKNLDSESDKIVEEFAKFDSKKQISSKKSKHANINVKTRSNGFLEPAEENGGTDEDELFQNDSDHQEEPAPPLWTTIFPPNPPPPPPLSWMNSASMFDLNVSDFLSMAGLCKLETARKINAPKPSVRLLRKRKT